MSTLQHAAGTLVMPQAFHTPESQVSCPQPPFPVHPPLNLCPPAAVMTLPFYPNTHAALTTQSHDYVRGFNTVRAAMLSLVGQHPALLFLCLSVSSAREGQSDTSTAAQADSPASRDPFQRRYAPKCQTSCDGTDRILGSSVLQSDEVDTLRRIQAKVDEALPSCGREKPEIEAGNIGKLVKSISVTGKFKFPSSGSDHNAVSLKLKDKADEMEEWLWTQKRGTITPERFMEH
ncbi:hypothetical protein GGF32_006377, partial [Allomyces javanicus]